MAEKKEIIAENLTLQRTVRTARKAIAGGEQFYTLAETAYEAHATGAAIGKLISRDFSSLSRTIENVAYNLTIIYGEKIGRLFLSQITNALVHHAINKNIEDTIDTLVSVTERFIDNTVAGETFSQVTQQVAQGVKKTILHSTPVVWARNQAANALSSVMGAVGEEIGLEAAHYFANEHIKDKLAHKISRQLKRIEKELALRAENERSCNYFSNQFESEKELLLYPEKIEERKIKAEALIAQQEKDRTDRKELEDSCTNVVTRAYYRSKHFIRDSSETVCSTVYNSVSSQQLATAGGLTAGVIGRVWIVPNLKAYINDKIGINITDRPLELRDFRELDKQNTTKSKVNGWVRGTMSWTVVPLFKGACWTLGKTQDVVDFCIPKIRKANNQFKHDVKVLEIEALRRQTSLAPKEREELCFTIPLLNVPVYNVTQTPVTIHRSKAEPSAFARLGCNNRELQGHLAAFDCFVKVYSVDEIKKLKETLAGNISLSTERKAFYDDIIYVFEQHPTQDERRKAWRKLKVFEVHANNNGEEVSAQVRGGCSTQFLYNLAREQGRQDAVEAVNRGREQLLSLQEIQQCSYSSNGPGQCKL